MIASNYRRFPEAMALQLVLVFGRCIWHTERPTTRHGRAMRAERSRLVKQTPQVVRWVTKAVPAWWRETKRAAKTLAKQVKRALSSFVWDHAREPNPSQRQELTPCGRTPSEHSTMLRQQMAAANGRVTIAKNGKPTRCGLPWCEPSNWDGLKCRAAYCGLKPKGGYL